MLKQLVCTKLSYDVALNTGVNLGNVTDVAKRNVKYGHFKATSSVVYHGTNLDVFYYAIVDFIENSLTVWIVQCL